ncbi:MAG: DUF2752 domain-containing protein [Actinobacteria bacterium]|nr:DUF2752 domain-containing protein [Actinomycetota bacterium]
MQSSPRDAASARAQALGLLAVAYLAYASVLPSLPAVHVCLFRRLTGRRCPLCGLTHGLNRALCGDFAGARSAHPLAVPAVAALAGCAATLLLPTPRLD